MKKASKVVIIGGEGNGGVVASCIDDNRARYNDLEYEVIGYANDFIKKGELINGYPVLGGLDCISDLLKHQDVCFMWAIHMIGKGPTRKKLFESTAIPLNRFATIVHKSSFVANTTILHPGAFIMANSYIGPASSIGPCTLVMANCCVGHNTSIGAGSHISAGAVVSSYVKAGEYSDICLAATVIEKVSIGNFAVAGARSLVLKDIGDFEVHVGQPAKVSRLIPQN